MRVSRSGDHEANVAQVFLVEAEWLSALRSIRDVLRPASAVTVNVRGVAVESGSFMARRGDDLLALPQYEEPQRSQGRSWPTKQGERLWSRH